MRTFRDCKYGCVALSISVIEIIIVCVGLAIIRAAGLWGHAPAWVRHFYEWACLGVPAAFILAVAGLVKDSWRICAAVALVLAVVTAVVYGTLLAV
jgi:hypothetical protein